MKAFGYAVSVLCCVLQLSLLSCLPVTGSNVQVLFQGQSKCLDDFSTKVRSVVDNIKTKSLSCSNAADLRLQVNEKVQLMRNLSDKCSWESNAKDYFECFKNIAKDYKKVLNEIALVKEMFSKNVEIIEQKKQSCLASISIEGRFETAKAGSDLDLCLQNLPQPQKDRAREEIISKRASAADMDDFLHKLDIVKRKYESLKDCALTKDYETCWKDATLYGHLLNETMSLRGYLLDHFLGNSSDYFTKITDIDLAENSCIRHYITMQLSSNFKFDMEGCIKFGLSSIEDAEENFEKDKQLIQNLIEIESEFKKCRQITKNLDTLNCIQQMLSESTLLIDLQQKTSIKSEKTFKKLKEIISYLYSEDYPCLEGLYASLRFSGLDSNGIDNAVARYCIMNGRKGRDHLPAMDEALGDLQSIQDYIKNCATHPESPGFEKCFKNAFWIHQGLLFFFNSKYENFKEAIEEYDKTNQSCFEKMVRESQQIYEENLEFSDLEKCVLKN